MKGLNDLNEERIHNDVQRFNVRTFETFQFVSDFEHLNFEP